MTLNTRPGELDDIEAAARFLSLGAKSLAALGNITFPECGKADEQMNGVRRSEISSVFSFFGEALHAASETVGAAADRLDLRLGAMLEQRIHQLEGFKEYIARDAAAKHPEYAKEIAAGFGLDAEKVGQ